MRKWPIEQLQRQNVEIFTAGQQQRAQDEADCFTLWTPSRTESEVICNGCLEKTARGAVVRGPRGNRERFELLAGCCYRQYRYRAFRFRRNPSSAAGVFPNEKGKLRRARVRGGWLKRVSKGLIGTNRPTRWRRDAILADWKIRAIRQAWWRGSPAYWRDGVSSVRLFRLATDRAQEIQRGETKGKPREKFTREGKMLAR